VSHKLKEFLVLVFSNPRPYVLDISKLRTSNNIPKTQALFYEKSKGKLYDNPVFTLDRPFDLCYSETENTKEQYFWSLRRLYLEAEDPHEYQFATTTLGSWDHWVKLCSSGFFIPHIEAWREELSIKLASKGVLGLLNKAYDGDVTANKFLASKEWHKIHQKLEAKTKDKKVDTEVAADLERIKALKGSPQLKVVK
jgi:hypothetical protein